MSNVEYATRGLETICLIYIFLFEYFDAFKSLINGVHLYYIKAYDMGTLRVTNLQQLEKSMICENFFKGGKVKKELNIEYTMSKKLGIINTFFSKHGICSGRHNNLRFF